MALAGVSLTILAVTLAAIAVLATITTIQRIVVTLRQASDRGLTAVTRSTR